MIPEVTVAIYTALTISPALMNQNVKTAQDIPYMTLTRVDRGDDEKSVSAKANVNRSSPSSISVNADSIPLPSITGKKKKIRKL